MLGYGLYINMITPPIYGFADYLVNERKIKIFVKANSKSRRETGRSDNRNTQINSNSLSSKIFSRLSLRKVEEKLIPTYQKIQAKNHYFIKDSKLGKNDNISKSSDLLTKSRLKQNKILNQFENFSGLQNLLNELLIDKKYKCQKCLKCICECPNNPPDSQSKRLKFKSRLDPRLKSIQKQPNPNPNPIPYLIKPNTSNDLSTLAQRKISFSLIQDLNYSTIHSQARMHKRSPLKKRSRTSHKSNASTSLNSPNCPISLTPSISPVPISNKPK